MFAINAVTGISGWIQKEEMHWLDNAGVPSRFFLGLRGAGTLSEVGEAKLFAGASRTLDEVVIIASSGQPQAFPCPVAHLHIVAGAEFETGPRTANISFSAHEETGSQACGS